MYHWRRDLSFMIFKLRGQNTGKYYNEFGEEERKGISVHIPKIRLIDLLNHCSTNVPYYAGIINSQHKSFLEDPYNFLKTFPILSKSILRQRFHDLKSLDLDSRRWYINTTGGSTGEPSKFIQDNEYIAQVGAISNLYHSFLGREIGEPAVFLWGAKHDVDGGKDGWKARWMGKLTNTILLSVFDIKPGIIIQYINYLNRLRPKLIVAYVEAIYEMARFAEQEKLKVVPQKAIVTTAGRLYPLMRETIERVFGCKVYNRYGSREVGDIACERPGMEGMWVAPWGYYIEIVDNEGQPVPEGEEGEILVTSLCNYAMPLIRYQIGDRGRLKPGGTSHKSNSSLGTGRCQVLESVNGRTVDLFINRKNFTVDATFFTDIYYYKDWVVKYQVIQKRPDWVLHRIKTDGTSPSVEDIEELQLMTRRIMQDDTCEVTFEFVDNIESDNSGKYRFIRSELPIASNIIEIV